MKIKLGPADFAEKEMRGYEVGTQNVCIAKVNGRYKGLDDWCNHAGCLLSGGRIEDNLIICPCHEVGFDLDTGKNETSPGIADDQRVVKVEVENGQIVIDDPKVK
jgi:3-phenylpropionate/trans-cinnamate dioxygenase ferredoxin component